MKTDVSPPGLRLVQTDGVRTTVTVKRRSHDSCGHMAVEVDESARTLHCRTCGAVLDAITFIIAWARRRESYAHEFQQLAELRAGGNAISAARRQAYQQKHDNGEDRRSGAYKSRYEESLWKIGALEWRVKEAARLLREAGRKADADLIDPQTTPITDGAVPVWFGGSAPSAHPLTNNNEAERE